MPHARFMTQPVRWLTLLTTICLGLAGCASLPPEDPASLYPVQVSDDVVIEDELQQRLVRFRVTWPDGDGAFPLVVFSHGALCNPDTYAPVTDYWAARGYVVVAPVHIDAPVTGEGGENLPPPMLIGSRIREMSLALDEIGAIRSQLDGFAGEIDMSRIGAAGHSFGGMITMLKTGMSLKGNLPPTLDERFSVAVVMSGVGPMPPITDEASFNGLELPLIANGGSLDLGNTGQGKIYPWEWRMSPYSLAPAGSKYALEIDGADHFLGGLIGGKATDNDPDAEALELIRRAQADFLDAYLRNDAAALARLENTNWKRASDGRATFKTR